MDLQEILDRMSQLASSVVERADPFVRERAEGILQAVERYRRFPQPNMLEGVYSMAYHSALHMLGIPMGKENPRAGQTYQMLKDLRSLALEAERRVGLAAPPREQPVFSSHQWEAGAGYLQADIKDASFGTGNIIERISIPGHDRALFVRHERRGHWYDSSVFLREGNRFIPLGGMGKVAFAGGGPLYDRQVVQALITGQLQLDQLRQAYADGPQFVRHRAARMLGAI